MGGWENIDDGYLWLTFDAAIANGVWACFSDEMIGYDPEYIVTFRMTHDARDDCEINFYTAATQVGARDIQKRFDDFINRGGPCPFPSNIMVLDITEFVPYITTKNLYMEVYDRDIAHDGTSDTGVVSSLVVERHDTYDPLSPADKTVTSLDTPTSTTQGSKVYLEVVTAGTIGSPPVDGGIKAAAPRATAKNILSSHVAGSSDIAKLKARLGVFEENTNYNRIIDGHGTGMRPPTEEQWELLAGRARIVDTLSIKGMAKSYPESLDYSISPRFPPIGNQGEVGSCASFSTVYYAKTFQEASEKGWNFSSTTWIGGAGGSPSNNQDKIFSPEFVYFLIDNGVDGGSNFPDNVWVLADIGASSWEAWPYKGTYPLDFVWPDEAAWREAPLCRGHIPSEAKWGTYFYFYIDDVGDLEIVKTLLANNILVSLIVDALKYDSMTADDVWNTDTYHEPLDLNHANTIVGYVHE